MIWSARPSSESGTVMPSVLAVFRLTISSTFVGCCTGRSAVCHPSEFVQRRRPRCDRCLDAAAIGHQSAISGEFVILINRGHGVADRELC